MTIQQQADSIVDKFRDYAGIHGEIATSVSDWDNNETINATHCAIIYCEGILNTLKMCDGGNVTMLEINYISILEQLESRL